MVRWLLDHQAPVDPMAPFDVSPDLFQVTEVNDGLAVRVWVWDLRDPSAATTILEVHPKDVDVFGGWGLNSREKRLVNVSRDRTARVWDLEADDPSASPIVLKVYQGDPSALAVSEDGKRLVTGGHDYVARVWDLEADDPGASAKVLLGHKGPITALALSADGRRLATGSEDLPSPSCLRCLHAFWGG